jgi:DNA invertase Pin-like site-specific DNA recombinase
VLYHRAAHHCADTHFLWAVRGMTRAVIYARRSPDEDAKTAVQNQLATLRAHCERQGWQVAAEVYDEGERGSDFTRHGILQLTELALSGNIDAIIATAQDRYHRDEYEFERWLREVIQPSGVALHTLTEALNDADPFAWQSRRAQGTYAELHARISGWKSKLGIQARLQQGYWCNKPPLGLRWETGANGKPLKGLLTADPRWWPAVAEIYELRAAKRPFMQIATMFNDRGLRTPKGRLWQQASVRRIVMRRIYRGEIEHQGIVVKDIDGVPVRAYTTHIIDADTWDMAQPDSNPGRPPKQPYLLAGLLYCPHWHIKEPLHRAGEPVMLCSAPHKGQRYYGLEHKNRSYVQAVPADPLAHRLTFTLDADQLENLILDHLQADIPNMTIDDVRYTELHTERFDAHRVRLLDELGAVQAQLPAVTERIYRALDANMPDTAKELEHQREQLRAKVDELTDQAQALDMQIAHCRETLKEHLPTQLNLIANARREHAVAALHRLVRSVIGRIDVLAQPPSYRLVVKYRLPSVPDKYINPTESVYLSSSLTIPYRRHVCVSG